MSDQVRDFTVGIEEEYLLVDPATRNLLQDAPVDFLKECERVLGGQVSTEFLQCQVEVGTKVCGSIKEATRDLAYLRRTVTELAEKHGLKVIAASTHPFASWHDLKTTENERYQMLAQDLQGVVRRLVICGMHVHCCIADPDLRIDLLNQVSYFLPHILALTTSSPFWGGEDTGLASYRLTVFDNLPRTGLPNEFTSFGEYERHVSTLIKAGVIEDSSKIWWDVRPSSRFPTLEMRICDLPTRYEDTITAAALFQCILHMLFRLRRSNQKWRQYAPMLVQENRWRAMRYGHDEGLIDFGKSSIVGYDELIEEIIELVRDDAEELDCVQELERAREIVRRGSSSHRQRAVYQSAIDGGATRDQALSDVVDDLVAETVHGI